MEEDKSKITAAIFYSITSTQKGLQVNKYYKYTNKFKLTLNSNKSPHSL